MENKLDSTFDVAIVGGGIIGICTAYYLQQQGITNICILEKGEIGQGASFGNAGWVTPSHVVPLAAPGVIKQGIKWMFDPDSPFYIKPRIEASFNRWLWKFRSFCTEEHLNYAVPILYELGMASRALFKELHQNESLDSVYQENGLLYVAITESGLHEIEEEAILLEKAGIRVQTMGGKDLHEKEPTIHANTLGGIYCEIDTHLNPSKFVASLAQLVESRGAKFFTQTRVERLDKTKNLISGIQTERGKIQANEIVLAGGAWSPELTKSLGIRLPIEPAKGYSITIPQTKKKTQIPVLLSEAKIAVTPLGDEIRYAGTLELAGMDLSINERRVNAIRKAVPKYFNNYDELIASKAQPWAGLRPCTPDGLPFINRSKRVRNLVVVGGHAMVGISLASISGKLAAEIISGGPNSLDTTPFSIERFDQ